MAKHDEAKTVALVGLDDRAKHDEAKTVALSYMEQRDEIMFPLEEWCNHRKRLVTELNDIAPFLDFKTYHAAAICVGALIGAGAVAVVGYFYPELVVAAVLLFGGIAVIVVLIEVVIKKEKKSHIYRALELLNLDVVFTSDFIKTIAPQTGKDSVALGIEERLDCRKEFKSAIRMKVYHAWKASEMPLHHTAKIHVPNLPEIAELLRNYVDDAKGECEDVRRMMTENVV